MSNGNNQKNTKMQEVQVKDFLMEFIPELFKNMGEDVHVRVSKEIDTMFVSVELDDPAVYIGKSGECLASLQFIINMILQRKEWNAVRITLDIGGYKRRQIDILKNIAQNAALKVRRFGRPVELQPMSAFARRIIHTTLKDNPSVFTHSIDEEPRRRVVVDLRK
ncbi:MAG TPA: R3H domain-containing nucleic acid-binding protein [Caldisericia bacterium]|jgi:spoIIIJ-associated protein|nr:MAG: R3H domain protein [bacterium ADurb.Bin132]HNW31184.1 R3H domain-containing nucleic acid-binding protein [Caldisericia bacterium]HNY60997.1 R3H domain-containing nucleic acid-binding protein [Caldisericia bacterium]HOC78929.1 R3H domain-containing nucleic acid-binding protein [Caldisericia bacterium]HOG69716.1 R3H domain-containing nucleic acid-binding protein [Caldisericia bacterium]